MTSGPWRWLNAEVHESTGPWDAGAYDTRQGTPVRKTVGVAVADLVVILVGIVGVIAAVTIPLFLLVESGLPSRWEGQITGTLVRIGTVVVPPMTARKVTARVTVHSHARQAMRACELDVAGYTARNGYLHGTSRAFDLEPSTSETIDLPLEVMRRVPGTHAIQIDLECSLRMKDAVRATLDVRE